MVFPSATRACLPSSSSKPIGLYEAGQSVAQVAAALGFDASSVYDGFGRTGVPMRAVTSQVTVGQLIAQHLTETRRYVRTPLAAGPVLVWQ